MKAAISMPLLCDKGRGQNWPIKRYVIVERPLNYIRLVFHVFLCFFSFISLLVMHVIFELNCDISLNAFISMQFF